MSEETKNPNPQTKGENTTEKKSRGLFSRFNKKSEQPEGKQAAAPKAKEQTSTAQPTRTRKPAAPKAQPKQSDEVASKQPAKAPARRQSNPRRDNPGIKVNPPVIAEPATMPAQAAPAKAAPAKTAQTKSTAAKAAPAKSAQTAPAKAAPAKAAQPRTERANNSGNNGNRRGRSPQLVGMPAKELPKPAVQSPVPIYARREELPPMPTSTKGRLKVIFLGGVEEIGKNITVLEYADDILVIDCGSIFPKEDLLGIDLVIPDVTYLQRNRDKIRGILVTHGHEDHIGAIPYVVKILGGIVPIYCTELTAALIDLKLKEHRAGQNVAMHVIKPGQHVNLGSVFQVDFIKMSHSIAGAVAMAVRTPMGVVVATGDFKVDYTPVDGDPMDFHTLAALGKEGVLALLMDSTNVERPGFTMSERKVGETFDALFPQAHGRIIIAMFASNVHRVQQVMESAIRFGRKVCLTGRSMINVSTAARNLGELHIEPGLLVDIDDIDKYPDDEIVVITTGSQGEQMSGLTRMAFSEHRKLDIRQSDMVVLSANPIPGNELSVSRVIDQLMRKGARVIYEALAEVHVSGHACQEELKLMHALLKPRFFIPVHGEYRMLSTHKRLAMTMGMPEENVMIPRLGDCVEFSRDTMKLGAQVPAGAVLVDGLGIGDVGNVVLRDRKHLSQDGLMVISMTISKETGAILYGPDVITRGFVYVRENDELMEQIRRAAQNSINSSVKEGSRPDWGNVKAHLRDDLHEFLYQKIKRTPMIIPLVTEL